ncbi:MAG: TIGR03773 family transporter-associated surface protein [Actinomyces sp.]|uniref:TIGR03773 family transporter-associated surface protein n=1 Tax=Actinomyces sp. TaxID=29317 RepID=UPI0028FF4F54|nr:TIGR03773 family transporter-associated surface protein [Actinomyces sp.]MDU2259357.1 TIGR03773 family transporter-associated surface protein [Actinomyces sp.]
MSTWILLPAPTQAEALSSSQDEHLLSDSLQVSTCLGDNNETLKSLCTAGEKGEELPLHDGALRLRTTPVTRDTDREIDGGYELSVNFNPSVFAPDSRYSVELSARAGAVDLEKIAPHSLGLESLGDLGRGNAFEEEIDGTDEFFRGFVLEARGEDFASGPLHARFAELGIRSLRLRLQEVIPEQEPRLIAEAEFSASIEAPQAQTQKSTQTTEFSSPKSTQEQEPVQSGGAPLPEAREAREASVASSISAHTQAAPRANFGERRLVLDHGHIDLFYMTLDDSGLPVLKVMEDVTGSGVQHEAEDIRLVVPSSALKHSLPQDIVAGGSGYFLPQTQDPTLPWPGWDVLSLAPAGFERVEFDVSYTHPDGGRISLWTEDFLSGRSSRLRSGGFELDPHGSTIAQDYLSHTHANWVFSQAGSYELSVQARAYRNDGSFETTRSATYLIEVGGAQGVSTPQNSSVQSSGVLPPAVEESAVGNEEESLTRDAPQRVGTERCIPTRITREAGEDEVSRIRSDSETPNQAITTLNVQVGSEGGITDGHFDLGPAIENGQLVARIKDDRSVPAVWKDPASLTFALGEKARIKAPEALSYAAAPGQDVWMIPATQIRGVPWLGMNSQREEIVTETSGQVRFSLLDVQGPGNVAVFESGSLGAGIGTHVFDGAGTSYTLPANTHAHQNWVFTEPGSYQLTIAMNVSPRGEDLRGSGSGTTGSLIAAGGTGEHGRPLVYAIVGRTASGQPCTLASTGSSTTELVPMILSALVMGCGCIFVSIRMRVRQ